MGRSKTAGTAPRMRMTRFLTVLCLAVAVAMVVSVGLAKASGYWNVWQGYFPDPYTGVVSAHSAYGGGGATWVVRMSWSPSYVDNDFSFIANNGSWHNYPSSFATGYDGSRDDAILYYGPGLVTSGVAQAGCELPSNYAWSYTNCRNASNY